jgi:hypothetical protein
VALGLAGLTVGSLGPRLAGGHDTWTPHYGHLGDGPLDALLHPWRVIGAMVRGHSLLALLGWLLPVGLLPLLKPRWIAALVLAGVPIFLSQWDGTTQPWFHYGAPFAPIAIGGALAAVASRPADRRGPPIAATVVGTVAALVLISPASPSAPRMVNLSVVLSNPSDPGVEELLGLIGPYERVSAPNYLVPHLSHRAVVYVYPFPFASTPDFFAEGSEPDRSAYPDQPVDVVVAIPGDEHLDDLDGYVEVARSEKLVLLRAEPVADDP